MNSELKQTMKDAGMVGAGGAGFPSYAKLAEGADTLVVNGAECEPLLYTDYIIMKREMDLVLSGVQSVVSSLNLRRALLCVKSHTAKRLSLTDGDEISARVFVKVLPDVYPIGDEISLIYEATGKIVRPGSLPISKGVIVYNIETMYNLGRAVKFSEPVTEKWLTVGGDISESKVVRVPIGVSIEDLFAKLGVDVPETHVVVDGGPSMGRIVNPYTDTVTKTTKALLVLPRTTPAIASKMLSRSTAVARAETACCQCTRCTDMCPRHLLGYPLEPHKMVRTAMGAATVLPEMVINATLCCNCGVCENLACSQGISPRAVISNYKDLLGKNRMKYVGIEDVFARAERGYRMIPSEKWAITLGVSKFDKIAVYHGVINDFDRVNIPLARHIGAPSTPCVENGDTVRRGQLIAAAADGLSVPQHASIDGRVYVTDKSIVIDR